MPSSLPDSFDARPRKMREIDGEALLKKVEKADVQRSIGRDLARAFELLGLQRKQVAALLNAGQPVTARQIDDAQISRWCSGAEAFPLARLAHDVPGFRGAFSVAMAEAATGHDINVVHTITWRRRA